MTRTYRIVVSLLALALLTAPGSAHAQGPQSSHEALLAARTAAIMEARAQLQAELQQNGGWRAWWAQTDSFRKSLNALRQVALQANTSFIRGRSGFVFLRDWETSYFLDTNVNSAANSRIVTTITDFSKQLAAHNIDLIVIPVPSRIEVYSDRLTDVDRVSAVHARKLLLLLSHRDVEVIDLLPIFKAGRRDDFEPLYHRIDTHWSSSGIELAAKTLATRLARYRLHDDSGAKSIDLTVIEQRIAGIPNPRIVDPDDSIAEEWRVLHVQHKDGTPYSPDSNSPVLVIGDSFVGHFEEGEMRGGIGSHLAHDLALNVDIYWRNAAGPFMPRLLRGEGVEFLEKRRVIIWIMAGQASVTTPGSLNRIWAPVKLW